MKTIFLTMSATINAIFILAIVVAFKCQLITIDAPQAVALTDEQYLMAIGSAGKEAKQEIAQAKPDIFSVLGKRK